MKDKIVLILNQVRVYDCYHVHRIVLRKGHQASTLARYCIVYGQHGPSPHRLCTDSYTTIQTSPLKTYFSTPARCAQSGLLRDPPASSPRFEKAYSL